jgi:hypothetical protein
MQTTKVIALDQPIYTPDQNHSHLLPHPAGQNCACAQYTSTTITQESGCQAFRQNAALNRACDEAGWGAFACRKLSKEHQTSWVEVGRLARYACRQHAQRKIYRKCWRGARRSPTTTLLYCTAVLYNQPECRWAGNSLFLLHNAGSCRLLLCTHTCTGGIHFSKAHAGATPPPTSTINTHNTHTHTPDCHQNSLAVNTRAINCKAAILPCSNSLKASTLRIRTIPTLSTPSLLSRETSLHLVLRDRCTALQGHHKGVAA